MSKIIIKTFYSEITDIKRNARSKSAKNKNSTTDYRHGNLVGAVMLHVFVHSKTFS